MNDSRLRTFEEFKISVKKELFGIITQSQTPAFAATVFRRLDSFTYERMLMYDYQEYLNTYNTVDCDKEALFQSCVARTARWLTM